jgi:hypothetical protein
LEALVLQAKRKRVSALIISNHSSASMDITFVIHSLLQKPNVGDTSLYSNIKKA